MKTLKPFQKEGVKFLLTHPHALLGDEMGLGKTIQAIYAAKAARVVRVLVICPASVKLNWKTEFLEAGYDEKHILVIPTGTTAPMFWGRRIAIVNYDLLCGNMPYWLTDHFKADAVIIDEGHYLKTPESRRTLAVLGPTGVIRTAKWIWVLTGTPLLNRPVELFPLLRVLAPRVMRGHDTYAKFTQYFCAAFFDGRGMNVKGAAHLEELRLGLESFMLRRTKAQVLPQLPPRVYQTIKLERTDAYDAIDKVELEMASRGVDKSYISEHFSQLGDLASLRRVTGVAKAAQVVSHVRGILDSGEKVVIFAHHKEVIATLLYGLKDYSPVCIRGGMTSDQKAEAVRKFQTDACRVFIGNLQAAGQGINGLQNVCNIVVFAEVSWVPGEMAQAVDRCHRIGQNKVVVVQYMIADGTIEQSIMAVAFRKEKVIDRVLPVAPQNNNKTKLERPKMMNKIAQLIDLLIETLTLHLEEKRNAVHPVLPFNGSVETTPPPAAEAPKKARKKAVEPLAAAPAPVQAPAPAPVPEADLGLGAETQGGSLDDLLGGDSLNGLDDGLNPAPVKKLVQAEVDADYAAACEKVVDAGKSKAAMTVLKIEYRVGKMSELTIEQKAAFTADLLLLAADKALVVDGKFKRNIA